MEWNGMGGGGQKVSLVFSFGPNWNLVLWLLLGPSWTKILKVFFSASTLLVCIGLWVVQIIFPGIGAKFRMYKKMFEMEAWSKANIH